MLHSACESLLRCVCDGTQTTEQEGRQNDSTDHHRVHSAPLVPLGRLQQQWFLRAEWMSDQPHQNTLHLLNTHVHMFNHSPVKHARRNIPPPAFLLQSIETLEDNTFTMGETVSNIGEVVTRVTDRHIRASPYRHAETMATMLVWSSGYTVANSRRYVTTPRVRAKAPSWISFTMNASSGTSCSHTIPKGLAGTKPNRG